ncbi:MAG: hypothetical protein AAF805_02375 [Planctomycetota bacterium]
MHPFASPALLFALLTGAANAADVVDVARSYADGGGYNRTWAGSGTPDAITHGGRTVLAASEGGTYCCGYTLCVAMRVAERRGLLDGKPFDAVKRFQKLWYGATELTDDTLCVLAVETLGVGHAVPLGDARPGDFVQLWRRGGSGHSVVFLAWVEEPDGSGATQRVGFRYRSSQGTTDGVGDATERFTDAAENPGRVLRERTYACRLFADAESATAASTSTTVVGSGVTDAD